MGYIWYFNLFLVLCIIYSHRRNLENERKKAREKDEHIVEEAAKKREERERAFEEEPVVSEPVVSTTTTLTVSVETLDYLSRIDTHDWQADWDEAARVLLDSTTLQLH